jgi:UPF0755 protein
MSRRVAQILAFGGIFFAFSLICAVWMWYRFNYTPLYTYVQTSVKVYPNTGIQTLGKSLYQKGLIEHPHLFVLFAKLRGNNKRLRFGEYYIKPGMSAASLLDNITRGKGIRQHNVRLVEGWRFKDIMQYLNKDPNLRHDLKGLSPHQIMEKLDDSKKNPEGLIFPDTYSFAWGSSELDILKKGYQKMHQVMSQLWPTRAKGLPYKKPYQALIIASMIEREVQAASERAKVAAVIFLRMKKRMRLQIDATVLYGLNKSYGSVITRSDLKTKTPYNTYTRYGLPPTPIAMPSEASIIAALHPGHGDALYYVARGDGTHVFTDTYQGHLSAVNRYQRGDQKGLKLTYSKGVVNYLQKGAYMKYAPYFLYIILW